VGHTPSSVPIGLRAELPEVVAGQQGCGLAVGRGGPKCQGNAVSLSIPLPPAPVLFPKPRSYSTQKQSSASTSPTSHRWTCFGTSFRSTIPAAFAQVERNLLPVPASAALGLVLAPSTPAPQSTLPFHRRWTPVKGCSLREPLPSRA
jgi:hypothetical protein